MKNDIIGMEAYDVVSTINEEIGERIWSDKNISEDIKKRMEQNSYHYSLEFMSNGYGFCIEFLGLQIWNSEDDQREYDDEKDNYVESLESYIHKEMINVLSDLELIKSYLIK